jgi:hypothetical protein
MINDNIYSKLTPSAKEALNELTEEFKESVLEKAYTIATERDTANREISLRDILEAKQPSKQTIEKEKYYEYKRKRWTMIISFSGAIYAVAGILIYLYQNKKFSIENDLGLIIAIVGILLSLIAFLYGQLLSKRQFSSNTFTTTTTYSSADSYEIVKRWQLIETLAKKTMSEDDQKNPMSNSVSFLIRFLSHKVAKNEKEFLKIRELLQLRNKILHEQYKLNDNERLEFLAFADDLIERLELAKSNTHFQKKTLKVVSAAYGTSKTSIDATKELNQLVKNNRLEFIANNEIVGDPEHGTVKQLNITFEINGVKQTKTFNEGDKVVIEG